MSSVRRVNMEVRTGELLVVVGGVAAGKSSLLQALLGPQAEARDQTAALELRESVAGGFGKQAAFSTKKRYPVHSEL